MKKFTAILLVFLSVGLIFAGGGKESSSAASSDGPVTITYYTWEDAAHKPLIDAFNASQDEIFVDAEILPSANYEARLTTLLSGQVEMDCFMEKRQADQFVQYNNGYIEPLTDYVVEGTPAYDAVKAYESQVVYDGEIIAIPWRAGSYYVYFNKKIFEAAGVPTPDTYVANGEWTWEKFEEVAGQISDPANGVYGACIYIWGGQTLLKSSQDHQPIVSVDGEIQFNDSFHDQLAMRKRMEAAGSMYPLMQMKVTGTHYSNLFYSGKIGMLIIGEWFPGQMTTGERDGLLQGFTAKDYGITRLPCDNETYTTYGASTNNHVTSYSKNKEAAYEFISWMAGPEASALAASYGVLPAVVTDEVRSILSESIPDETSLNTFLEDRDIFTAAFGPYGSRVESFIDQFQESYILGNIPDSDFDNQFRAGLEEIVRTQF